ncbi:dnaJ-like protein 60 [Adelges cooleyi]|uniref:dnaJ-like protein 60 n=1 Tax=Adelges cooleyi TaxID=133065 RepID=UPI00218087E3|nr:dnaJ-like protein 60 [Adelges cooleyi]
MINVGFVQCAIRVCRLSFTNISIQHFSSKTHCRTHYEVLNLKPGCTKKEIRDSFIKMSKQNHPDIHGASYNDQFVRINEAYNVLINEDKQRLYNETLVNYNSSQTIYSRYPQRQTSVTWKEHYNNPANHWLASNFTIAGVCLAVLVIGSIIRYYGAKKSSAIRSQFLEESDQLLLFLEEQKLMKSEKSKNELIEIFEKNIANDYKPTIEK